MSAHFSDSDLLEIYYLERENEPEVAQHVAACERCSNALAATRTELHEAAAFPTPDDAFFERQRDRVMRRVQAPRPRAIVWRYATAAALFLAISGVAVHRVTELPTVPVTATHAVTTAAATTPSTDPTVPRDVWETDVLTEFHPLVDWESWEETKTSGGRS